MALSADQGAAPTGFTHLTSTEGLRKRRLFQPITSFQHAAFTGSNTPIWPMDFRP